MAYRNPSPPPDVSSTCEEDKDQLSETVLSKSWLLSVMAKTVKDTKYRRPDMQQENCQQESRDDKGDEAAAAMELDTEFEDDLCKLWDASINEVSNFYGLPAAIL